MDNPNMVNFTPPSWRQGDVFTFDGNSYVVAYAKYLIQYLEAQFAGKDPGFKL
jgi:hypothetical protein